MANDIGTIRSVNGMSTSLNCQTGQGTQKPVAGNYNPGNTQPPKAPEGPVPMPK